MSLHAHSSSAVDIPASPSRSRLEPSPTRKRNSWGQENSDPDPFYSPHDPWSQAQSPRYGTPPADDASSSLAGPSSVSSLYGDDDEARLTTREEEPGAARRRTLRYSTSPSPLKKTGTAIKHVSQNLRRASIRVVNMASVGLERLPDDKQDMDEDDTLPDLAQTLPIRGRTLGFMGPTNRVRLACFNFLVYPWTEPIILLLIIFNAVVLTIQASRSFTLSDPPVQITGYFHSWEDYALFVLFILFTLEAFARIAVSGLLFDPEVRVSWSRAAFALPSVSAHSAPPPAAEPLSLPFRLSIAASSALTRANAPYLRHSWSRIDALAILSFFASFALASLNLEDGTTSSTHIRVFRAMAALRTARLLTITSGTTAILHSLKTARPLLASVAYFVVFAMGLFSIIGVQTFKGSLRRSCILLATADEDELNLGQGCGGYINATTGNATAYIPVDGDVGDLKGYVCPIGQVCVETEVNPYGNTESFDTIYYSALQVVIVASTNGWSPLMYNTIDSEYFVASVFFILCIVVLNFWLINLFVAVITNTFGAIRAETKRSAFGAGDGLAPAADPDDDGWATSPTSAVHSSALPLPRRHRTNPATWIILHTRWLFVALALTSLALQATRTPDITEHQEQVLYFAELGITGAFDMEILLRLCASLPDWRAFFGFGVYRNPDSGGAGGGKSGAKGRVGSRKGKDGRGAGQNWLDTGLAVMTTVIQVPAVQRSAVYPWFTIFQLMRFYRVILVVPRMKPLLLAVFGNMYGLVNMTLFLIIINFIAAVVSVQFLRGDIDAGTNQNFGSIYNAFLAIYQIFSSENWTNVLYSTAQAESALGQGVLAVLFVSGWLLFANFIVLQMFVAVINENFDVAEEAKKGKQATTYWANTTPQEGRATWLRRLNPYRWIRARPVEVRVEALPAGLVLPMQKSLVQAYSVPRADAGSVFDDKIGSGKGNGIWDGTETDKSTGKSKKGVGHYSTKSLTALQKLFAGEPKGDIPLTTFRHVRGETLGGGDPQDEETERHLELIAAVRNETQTTSEDTNDALYERRAQKADFIRDHPSYDKTFWLFSQKNFLRRGCQKLVQPAGGPRIFGTPQSPVLYPLFQVTLLLIVIGGIVVESIANPVYRRNYFSKHGLIRGAWFDLAESAFGLVFFVEFLTKIVADGFLFTPNAYVRSIWNLLDFIIMAGLLVNVTTGLIFVGGLSRLTRSLKALRALRLITLIDRMRTTFESLIISGALRILDAGILAILYMIPYAVWGLNIFNGKMNECNDTNATGSISCTNEFINNGLQNQNGNASNAYGFLAPRVWANPAPSTVFSFDSFRSSLLILFEIVSLEGWVDVMNVATSITGDNSQPEINASQVNAIFFLIYNLLGAVVILTLFVSIIIGNFSSKTGSAFLTAPQREWIDLQKLFRRQRPSKRPRTRPVWPFRAWCYERAVNKHGWWSRTMTAVFVIHIIALMTQTFTAQHIVDGLRNDFFLVSTSIYCVDVLVRMFGLGWRSYRSNGWNLFDAIVAGGSFITSLIVRFGSIGFATQQLQKLFLVCIAFKLVQRTDNLNKLFKTAVASLPIIFSLLSLWFILFLFFGILFLEVFALTKWNSAETRNENFSTMGSTLVMLSFFTTGEGWNQYMHDYTIVYPRCTNFDTEENSDCGSAGWAFTLFIAWNLLSMYIFVNMFTGVVVENFSYVFQTSGSSKSITRAQMRTFKKVWAEFANPKTGYLERSQFVPFFGKLSGVFEARIYPVEFSIPNIQAMCKPSNDSMYASPGRVIDGIDLNKLDKALKQIDYASIRKRRAVYSRLYHEATLTHQHGRGMSFTDMLFLLAHHKLIVDREALVLKDLVVRTETNKLVTDLVNLDRVRSLLKTISHRRRFLRYQQQQLMTSDPAIPSIIVDVMPATPPHTPQTTRDISSAIHSTPSSPTPQRFFTPDVSLSSSTPRLHRSNNNRRTSDISMLSGDIGYKSRDSSISIEDPQQILQAMETSVWGDLMLEAEEEEKR
ncbi:Ion transport protein-domain-containing protein [Mycena maculata]|uniref:Calcium-channel protein CCH1 n=1 Tax=Mycena maculata TaxID=230809 RepID=A0AAD7MPK5_9AGAR|nr:Ion transport protein-domain-containing protein [Mycena maculata]